MYENRTVSIQLLILHLIIQCILWPEKHGIMICSHDYNRNI